MEMVKMVKMVETVEATEMNVNPVHIGDLFIIAGCRRPKGGYSHRNCTV